jgi:hypothetical protein
MKQITILAVFAATLSYGQTVSCSVSSLTSPPCTGSATRYEVTLSSNISQSASLDWTAYEVAMVIPSGKTLTMKGASIAFDSTSSIEIQSGGALTYKGNTSSNYLTFGGVNIPCTDFATITSSGGVNISGALPVEMIYLMATNREGIVIEWATASEYNSDYFILSHSRDGINYNVIDSVKSAGISYTIKQYKSTFNNPSIGMNHFKLLQRDFDGKEDYFYTSSIYNNVRGFKSYPNPFSDIINVEVSKDSEVRIVNSLGVDVYSSGIIEAGTISIDTYDIPSGVYMLYVDGGVKKIIKK